MGMAALAAEGAGDGETRGDLWVIGLTEEGSPGGTFRTFLGCPSV